MILRCLHLVINPVSFQNVSVRTLLGEVLPRPSVLSEHGVGPCRSPRAGRIIWKITGRKGSPHVESWRDDPPSCLDHVSPLKERGIADHAVEEKPFITGAYLLSEMVQIVKVHIDRTHIHDRAGDL